MRGQEVTQPNFRLKRFASCYRCADTRECVGKPAICEACEAIIARTAKIGSEDRRSIRAKPHEPKPPEFDWSYFAPVVLP